MKRGFAIITALGAVTAAHAIILDDFESGNLSTYTTANGGAFASVTGAAAYSGNFGVSFPSTTGPAFYYDTARVTSAGTQTRAKVRATTDGGRIYLGVNASAGGTWSAVLGWNTSQLILQNNSGWGFVTSASAAFDPVANTWYTLEMDWKANGDMIVNVYDDPGANLLATTGAVSTGLTGSGGVSFRGFSGTGGEIHMDNIEAVPEPATMAALGIGVAAMLRRRRK